MKRDRKDRDTAGNHAVRRAPARSRRGLYIRSGLAVLALGVIAVAGWWLRTSATFAVERVESGSYRFTSQTELEGILGNFLGRNIWTLHSSEVADSLAVLPWVRDLKVHRRLPGSIEVDFREWRPLLVIEKGAGGTKSADEPLVVVEDGQVLEFPEHLVLPGLPVLVGVEYRADSSTGARCLNPDQLDAVLDLVWAVENSGLESASPIDFIVARAGGFAIVLQEGQGSLLVGHEDFSQRLDRYMTARDHLEPGLQMDLRFADRITCRRI